jgi:O-methyltransferase/methyltransferase family protein
MTILYKSPTADDRVMWDLHQSSYALSAVMAADEAGIFQSLADAPADAETFAARHGFSDRAVSAILPMLAAMGFLTTRGGVYSLSNVASTFLAPSSSHYWGPVLAAMRRFPPAHAAIVKALHKTDDADSTAAVGAWESGDLPEPLAKLIAGYMHSHSLAGAVGMACAPVFRGVRRLLDVGGGSGCYSIALAQANTDMRCVVMELPAMCALAREYITAAGVEDRVSTVAVNMFREQWPNGFDGVLFSNIFHDWDFDTCRTLAARAFASLTPGGRIFLHEALLDDTRAGPLTVAAFSVQMLVSTRGQQFTLSDLSRILEAAGFARVEHVSTHAYHSVVSAVKPTADRS